MKIDNNLIYDVGAHNGKGVSFYLTQNYSVIAIDASVNLCNALKNNFKQAIDSKKLIVLNLGISNESKDNVPFYINEISEFSSFKFDAGTRMHRGAKTKYRIENVNCRTFDSVLEEFGVPFYLKVDIEGYDGYCLDALQKHCTPKFISIENQRFSWIQELKDLGYTKFKLVGQADADDSFGDNVRDINNGFEWINYDSLISEIHEYCELQPDGDGIGGDPRTPNWFDVHATY